MTTEYQELMSEHMNNASNYTVDILTELMKIRRLDRITDALERIADSLEALDKCVGSQTPTPYMKEGYHFLRIDGYVNTDN